MSEPDDDGLDLTVRFIADGAVELRQVPIGDGFPKILLEPGSDGEAVKLHLTVGGGLDRKQVTELLVAVALMLDIDTVTEMVAESLEDEGLKIVERTE